MGSEGSAGGGSAGGGRVKGHGSRTLSAHHYFLRETAPYMIRIVPAVGIRFGAVVTCLLVRSSATTSAPRLSA